MRAGMGGASRDSFAEVRGDLDALLRVEGVELPTLADELFSVATILDREGTLRRVLTDPSRSTEDRAQLARDLFGSQVGESTSDLLTAAVRGRWSAPRDLADAMELLAVEALVAGAEKAGRLDTVEDELFRAGRVIAGTPPLRVALGDRSAPVAERVALAEDLFGSKVTAETMRLLRQAVENPRGRNLDQSLEAYGAVAADRRQRLVATVTAAVPLTEEQRERLSAVLARGYGHEVHLNVQVDPELVGGLRVEIGDEIIDGSLVAKLADARRRLVG